MYSYIALFRGINVGGKNILPMKELVAILEALGYQKVKTYIQSGNVVLKSSSLAGTDEADAIRQEIFKAKGFAPNVFLLTMAQFQNAITNNPFPATNGKALHLYFLEAQPIQPQLEKLDSLRNGLEQFRLHEEVFYLYAPEGIGRSKLASAVEKLLGVPVTARNWNTVSRLAALAESA